jgi:hypothetical protein
LKAQFEKLLLTLVNALSGGDFNFEGTTLSPRLKIKECLTHSIPLHQETGFIFILVS